MKYKDNLEQQARQMALGTGMNYEEAIAFLTRDKDLEFPENVENIKDDFINICGYSEKEAVEATHQVLIFEN